MRSRSLRRIVVFGLGTGLLLPAVPSASLASVVDLERAPPSALPFSPSVEFGTAFGPLVQLSGQIGLDPATGALVPGGIEAETRQVMENIQALLRERGLRMRHVVKCTVFLRDIRDRDAMSAIYVSYFPEQLPARSAVGVTGLSQGAAVEIECLAARGRRPSVP